MTQNSKRIRCAGEGSSSNPPPPPPQPAPASPSESQPQSPPPVSRFPWPREEGTPIYSERQWANKILSEFEKPEYINRELSDDWGDYETLLYNGWLKVEIQPTRFKDKKLLEDMSMGWAMSALISDMGIGYITDLDCELYPDLVRQFMASVRVDYQQEYARNAQEGTLSFFAWGVRHSISIPDLCDLYGFRADGTACALPAAFDKAKEFWAVFAERPYVTGGSTHSDIRHPALRYLVRLVSNTFLCKMEPGKMRLAELILLYYALHEDVASEISSDILDVNVNMGAVFAHHLVELKTKPFSGKSSTKKKVESVGSLLTPLFRRCNVDLSFTSVDQSRRYMDRDYLKRAHWMDDDLIWKYTSSGEHLQVRLPQSRLGVVRKSMRLLSFEPDPREVRQQPPARRRRGASSSAPPSAAENDPALPDWPTYAATEMDNRTFQQLMMKRMDAMWEIMKKFMCARPKCTRRHVSDDENEGSSTEEIDD